MNVTNHLNQIIIASQTNCGKKNIEKNIEERKTLFADK